MKILLIGNTGFIGTVLYNFLKKEYEVTGINSQSLDITDCNILKNFIINNSFDLIILCAACKDIKKLENNPDYAYQINTQPAKIISQNSKSRIVFISTDYVFDGQKGSYKDTDKTNPTTIYGKTKNDAEKNIQENSSNYTIIRTAAVLGKGSLFFDWLLNCLKQEKEIEIFEDCYFSPTPVNFLCEIIEHAINDTNPPRIIHAVCEKKLSRFELAQYIAKTTDSKCKLIPIKTGFKDYSLQQSEYVKNIQKKTFEQYLKDELRQCTNF